ncbi:MAG: fibrobacter succinogenes major paralogous domain-containing protein [Flavobacteriaceae bacterium]|nr:fibrobacter succinogenes major paralogous domain-containing protein [Flavobacteriaceae bacterium]
MKTKLIMILALSIVTVSCKDTLDNKYDLSNSSLTSNLNEKNLYRTQSIQVDPSTISIGDQIWAKEDLNVTTFNNGDIIFEAKTENQWKDAGINKIACYRRLGNGTFVYNGYALNDSRGLLREGLSIPEKTDFQILINYLGGGDNNSGKATQALTTYEWYVEYWDDELESLMDKVIKGNNSSGFGAVPGGFVYDHGGLDNHGACNFWWTNTKEDDSLQAVIPIGYCSQDIGLPYESLPLSYGFAIRGIKK